MKRRKKCFFSTNSDVENFYSNMNLYLIQNDILLNASHNVSDIIYNAKENVQQNIRDVFSYI